MSEKKSFNLLFPEWQGYGENQDVYHGAMHLCQHVTKNLQFSTIDVHKEQTLSTKDAILGLNASLKLFDQAAAILEESNPNQIFMVGGTCACEMAPVSYLNRRYDSDLAVLWFDAHGDLNTPESSPSGHLHGMPLRSLLGEGNQSILDRIKNTLTPQQVAMVGSRDLDVGEINYIEHNGLPVFGADISNGSEVIDFVKTRGFTNVYIHFDLDVLEPSEFPHVLVPTEDGMRVDAAIRTISEIRNNFSVVGMSVVEYCPKDGGGTEELRRLIHEGMGQAV